MNGTIKVLCYKSKILSNGEHPLMLCVCKDNKRKYQSLGISVSVEHWDFKNNCPNDRCPNREQIIILINEKVNEIQRIALDKRMSGKDYSASTLLDSAKPSANSKKTVGEYYLTYISNLKKENRVRYAGMYEISYNSFLKFNKHLDIPFSDIDVAWLKRYEAWGKSQNLSVSTISTRIRHLRAVFNLALLEHAIKKDCYPFHAYKVSKLNKATAKRALTKDEIRRVMEYQGKGQMEKLAIDIFTFSYLCAGINFIDMAKLKYSNIQDNQLIYNREKTKKLIIVPLQERAIQIIEKYNDGKKQYVFPILSGFHKSEIQIANRLHKVLAKINKHLKQIGKELNLSIPQTTYVARHSFATVLKRAGISTSIISESLGHSSERITQVYLDSFDKAQMSNAMKALL
ncbi:MAG: site-specific integrase [Bacteroides sp.]|nr:site-specific integrase [Bacteroides sp.]